MYELHHQKPWMMLNTPIVIRDTVYSNHIQAILGPDVCKRLAACLATNHQLPTTQRTRTVSTVICQALNLLKLEEMIE